MLVLARKELERIKIGEDITITILEVKSDTVRVGIDAPTDVPITREDPLPDAIPAKQRRAAKRERRARS